MLFSAWNLICFRHMLIDDWRWGRRSFLFNRDWRLDSLGSLSLRLMFILNRRRYIINFWLRNIRSWRRKFFLNLRWWRWWLFLNLLRLYLYLLLSSLMSVNVSRWRRWRWWRSTLFLWWLDRSFVCEYFSFLFRLIYRLTDLFLRSYRWRWRIVQVFLNWYTSLLCLRLNCILIGRKCSRLLFFISLLYSWRWRRIFCAILLFWWEYSFFAFIIWLFSFNYFFLHFTRLHSRKRDNFVANACFVFL